MWKFEAVEGDGGIGVDSSEDSLGMKDIDGNGVGGVDGVEDRIIFVEMSVESLVRRIAG